MLTRILEPEYMDCSGDAAAYDAMDHTVPNAAVVERLVDLGATGHLLDLGTGPGHIPILACHRFPGVRITAIDAARSMLDIAREKIARAGYELRITLEIADAKRLPYADASFDGVLSNTILHHLADPAAMLREAVRVLRPGGLLMIRDLFRPDTREQLDALVAEHAANDTPEQRKLFADSLRAALTPDELRELASELDLDGWEVVVDTDRHMTLQRPMGSGADPRAIR
ncbi:MAG: class I SAM-dependent methyltransferase [Phycisphaeraceae bacterium]